MTTDQEKQLETTYDNPNVTSVVRLESSSVDFVKHVVVDYRRADGTWRKGVHAGHVEHRPNLFVKGTNLIASYSFDMEPIGLHGNQNDAANAVADYYLENEATR